MLSPLTAENWLSSDFEIPLFWIFFLFLSLFSLPFQLMSIFLMFQATQPKYLSYNMQCPLFLSKPGHQQSTGEYPASPSWPHLCWSWFLCLKRKENPKLCHCQIDSLHLWPDFSISAWRLLLDEYSFCKHKTRKSKMCNVIHLIKNLPQL